MKTLLLKSSYRDYMLFVCGINLGLRIGDLCKIRVKDLRGKSFLNIKEEKTGKQKNFPLNSQIIDEIDKYTEDMNDEDWMFPSRVQTKGEGHITRVQAFRTLNKISTKNFGFNCSGHVLRKTFGYHFYYKTKDVAMLQTIFNHSSQSITLRYICVTDDQIREIVNDFFL